MKKLFFIFIVAIMICLMIVPVGARDDMTTFSEVYIPSERTNIINIRTSTIYLDELTIDELMSLIEEQKMIKENIHKNAEVLRQLDYADDSIEVIELKRQWDQADSLQTTYEEYYNKKLRTTKAGQYPTATFVWNYLKNLGYNDAVCAGILGNMMIECAGGTLDLNWNIYGGGGGFYGLCQWSKQYFPQVYGADLRGQMDCLRDTIKEQIDYAGFVYGGYGFVYEDFLAITDPGEAAICFAKAYERCASQHVYPRAGYARTAYEYFTN